MRKIAILYLLGALLVSGCVRDEFDTTRVVEGAAARISLKITLPVMGGGTDTRAVSADVEKRLDNLFVLVFDGGGKIVTRHRYTAQTGASLSSLLIDTRSGKGHTLCFVANVKDGMDSQLMALTSYNALKGLLVTATELNLGQSTDVPLIMTAIMENVNVQEGANSISNPVQLQFLAAKVTLTLVDNTPDTQEVTIIGWDVQDAPTRSYLFPDDSKDANPNPETAGADKDEYWLTTGVDYPFEEEDKQAGTATQTLYVFENRRGGRIPRALPADPDEQYSNMGLNDKDSRGKAWYKPKRATAIVVTAMHKADLVTRQIKAFIYLGQDNHSDYNIRRGHHYTFTVTVNGLNEIKIDSNVDFLVGDFLVDHGDNLTMDAHPDFRPMRIQAPKGTATMEILDSQGRTYDDPSGFDATWLKISPLNLMYHQVKQPGNIWQQDADPDSKFVRPKYIPHKSVRAKLASKGGWNAIPAGKDNDDEMTFADATHRMCYKITDIPFTEVTVTPQTLYVYADDFPVRDGTRNARVRFTYHKDGDAPDKLGVMIFDITQRGYISFYLDDSHPDAGLYILNEDGTPSNVKRKTVIERFQEYRIMMNPGIPSSVQWTGGVRWGFSRTRLYNKPDFFRNGKYMTANAVYNDVVRNGNEPTEFGKRTDSYREMYGNSNTDQGSNVNTIDPIPPYTGSNSGAPYYYPDPEERDIYHPIFRTSAARYCHEKNRDLNGDGIIDDSEAYWYLPSAHELIMWGIAGVMRDRNANLSSSESNNATAQIRSVYMTAYDEPVIAYHNKYSQAFVRCFRELEKTITK
ncbi:DUF4906 domain-containing protein [Bacteroides stercoris]|jgi:hypothetical protein|uniref:DUF4906 domain-containing protein n=1 Tax=Bacteroides stercoris TaxID=46506 RepID=UPI0018A02C0A|nr:DUF4906 domain-containing protein [Bacteroides stercoris]